MKTESERLASSRAGLVLEPAPHGRCDDFRLGGATVLRDENSGVWRMWYYCRSGDLKGPPTLGTGRIALATSQDGANWQRVDGGGELGSVFEPSVHDGAFDHLHVGISDVTIGPDGYNMWYFGGSKASRHSDRLGSVAGLGMLPGLATSRDGLNWRRQPGTATGGALVPLPAERLYRSWPNVFHHDGALYMQLTEAASDLSHFHTSLWRRRCDGGWDDCGDLQWADRTPGYDEAGMVTRQVLPNFLPEGGRFLMIYTGVDRHHRRSIALAGSDDGVCWKRLYRKPVFGTGGEGAWDSMGVAANRLVHVDGRLFLYYYGFQTLGDEDGKRGVGLAVAPDANPLGFRRIASV